jgi:hypothetical protein
VPHLTASGVQSPPHARCRDLFLETENWKLKTYRKLAETKQTRFARMPFLFGAFGGDVYNGTVCIFHHAVGSIANEHHPLI